jgi:Holliday junction resolvase
MKHIDFKVTVWQRYYLTDEEYEKVKDYVEDSEATAILVFNACEDAGFIPNWEYLDETEEDMTVKENGGMATIEAYESDTGKLMYKNGE